MFKENYKSKKIIALLLAMLMIFGQLPLASYAKSEASLEEVEKHLDKTLDYMYKSMAEPVYGTEWRILSLARSGINIPDSYYSQYKDNLSKHIEKQMVGKENGRFSDRSTDYSRVILALTSLGYNPRNIDGVDLIKPLEDMDFINASGITNPIYGLLALDSKEYKLEGKNVTREKLVKLILDAELEEGGWTWVEDPDIDLTSMAIQALAPYYKGNKAVKESIDRNLKWLASIQKDSGAYESWGVENSSSTAQVLTALTELEGHGVEVDYSNFTKKGNTLVDGLMKFKLEDAGFKHEEEEKEINPMATDQVAYALISYFRVKDGKTSLYNMTDVEERKEYAGYVSFAINRHIIGEKPLLKEEKLGFYQGESAWELLKRQLDERKIPYEYDWLEEYNTVYIKSIGNLAEKDHGEKSGWLYLVNKEFPSTGANGYILKDGDRIDFSYSKDYGQDLIEEKEDIFTDLKNDWSKDEIESLARQGIIEGRGNNKFLPKEKISRAEFVTLVNRVLGHKELGEVPFKDVAKNKWYYEEIGKIYKSKLVQGVGGGLFKPETQIKREEIAQILGNVLVEKGFEKDGKNYLSSFTDKNKVSSWSQDNLELLVQLGLFKGNKLNQLNPRGQATREEAAVLIYRFNEIINN